VVVDANGRFRLLVVTIMGIGCTVSAVAGAVLTVV